MKNIEFIFPLFFMLSSCNWGSDCNKIKLSDELVEWTDCYKVGDTIVLMSDIGNYDSLKVTSKESEYSPCNKFELGPNQYEYVHIILNSISINIDECKNNMIKKTNVVLRLNVDKIYDKGFIGVDVYNFGSHHKTWESAPLLNTKLKIPYLDDSIKVFEFDDRNAQSRYPYLNSEYPCAIKSFHWSKEDGLVQYETEEDEIYRLIKK